MRFAISLSKSSPPQSRIALDADHLEIAAVDLEQRGVERSPAEVVDQAGALLVRVEPVGDGRRSRLVEHPQHVDAGDLARLLCCRATGIVEIRRNRDHRIGDRLAQIQLGILDQALQDDRRDLLCREHASVGRIKPVARFAHHALDRAHRGARVPHGGVLRHQPHKGNFLPIICLREEDDRGRRILSLGVWEHLCRMAVAAQRHSGIGRSQIDANYCHFTPISVILANRHSSLDNMRVA